MMQNDKNTLKGMLYIISAPSGAGKTSLIKVLLESTPNLYVSVSHTTRARRPYEKDGADYHFIDEAEFLKLVDQNLFLEHAQVFDNFYGTSKQWVEEQLSAGKNIILEIDWQGAQQVRRLVPNTVNIFILPPSFHSLQDRLNDRGDEREIIARRMQEARNDIKQYREFDYLIINDNFHEAIKQLLAIFETSSHAYKLQSHYFDSFVDQLLLQSR